MNKKHLLEAATLASESASADGTWKVRLISEGKGSSGIYTRELLENHHKAFDNLLSYKNHPVGWDGPQSRDFTMIAGEIIGETWVENDERGMAAVYGNYLPDEEYREKLERYKSKLGLSIYIEGSGYENENGEFVVDWFNPEDPFASVDVVVAPGARGKFMESMQQFYSAQTESKGSGARQTDGKKEIVLDQELKDALKGISDTLAGLVAKDQAAKAAEAQVTADAEAVKSAVEAYAAAEKAIADADLLDVQVESLRAAAKAGQDIAPLIESAKAVKDAAVKAVKESAEQDGTVGVVLGESATKFGAWK